MGANFASAPRPALRRSVFQARIYRGLPAASLEAQSFRFSASCAEIVVMPSDPSACSAAIENIWQAEHRNFREVRDLEGMVPGRRDRASDLVERRARELTVRLRTKPTSGA